MGFGMMRFSLGISNRLFRTSIPKYRQNCVLMQDDTPTRYDVCGIYEPTSDEIDGIDAMY